MVKSEPQKIAVFFFICLLVLLGFSFVFQALLLPFSIGLIVTYLLYPLTAWLVDRTSLPRLVVVVSSISFFIVVAGVLFVLFVPSVLRQLEDVISLAPAAYNNFLSTTLPKLKLLLSEYQILTSEQFEDVFSNLTMGLDYLSAVSSTVLTLWETAPKIFGTFVGILFVPLVSFLFLQHGPFIRNYFYSLIPRKVQRQTDHILLRLNQTLRRVIKGQVYVAATLAVLYSIGFTVIGLRAGLAIGIVAGVARFVPYLDILVGLLLSSIVIASSADPFTLFIGVVIVIASVQGLDGLFITPRLIGANSGLHPIIVICSIVAFSSLLGFLGIVIAIPVVATIKEGFAIAVDYYRKSQFYTN